MAEAAMCRLAVGESDCEVANVGRSNHEVKLHPHGAVSEWLKETVLKTVGGLPSVGSNPTRSAKCGYDGIGRHPKLKISCIKLRMGSSPITRTIYKQCINKERAI